MTMLAESTVAPSRAPASPPVAEPAPVLELRDVRKRFAVRRGWREIVRAPRARQFREVLAGVTLQARPGECAGLLGPNGAGKTTLFRIVGGLVAPDSGTVRIFGAERVGAGATGDVSFASVDERSLHWRLSVEENVGLFARLHGVRGAALRPRVMEALEAVDLVPRGADAAGTLSSGLRQRLLIARALVARPRLLLLDEPTRSLDPLSARDLRHMIRTELVERRGCAVLLATHNREEALELCDRITVLHRGRVLAEGPPADVAHRVRAGRHRVWTTTPAHPAFRALVERGLAGSISLADDSAAREAWRAVELTVPGGDDETAEVLRFLVHAGVTVARVERVPVDLVALLGDLLRGEAGDA